MDVINFSIDTFPSLIEREDWTGQWNNIAVADLPEDEAQILADFEAQLGAPNGEFPEDFYDKVLLVKCSEQREHGKVVDRLVDRIYGPGIYRNEANEVVLKYGEAFWSVTQEKSVLIVGNLRGSIDFAEKPRDVKIKVDGKEKTVKVQNCWCTFVSETQVYEIPINTDPVTNPIKNTILMHCNQGRSLSNFLKTSPKGGSGGGSIVNMKELGDGEYSVAECYLKDTPNNVDSSQAWIIRLEDGQQCWARGMTQTQLDKGFKVTNPCTLTIANTRHVKDKTYLDCVLRNRPLRSAKQGKNNLPF